ncbi:MAG: hypothetical protein S4CHLAM37_01730 [Chlamydiia bacterium]|nr:hypothetical protein [Chlamydiia bacterium]
MATMQSALTVESAIQSFEDTMQLLSVQRDLDKLTLPSEPAKTPIESIQSSAQLEREFIRAKTVFLREVQNRMMSSKDIASLKRAQVILEKRKAKYEFVFQDKDFSVLSPSRVREKLKGRIEKLESLEKMKAVKVAYKEVQGRVDAQVADNSFVKLKLNFALMQYEETGSLAHAMEIVALNKTLDVEMASCEPEVFEGAFTEFLDLRKKHLTKAQAQVRINELQEDAIAKVKGATYVTKEVAKAVADAIKVTPLFERYVSQATAEQDGQIKVTLAAKLQEVEAEFAKLQAIDARSEGAMRPASPVEVEMQSEALNVLTLADQITCMHSMWERSTKEQSRNYILAYLKEEVTLRKAALELDPTNVLLQKRLTYVEAVKSKVEAFDARAKREIGKLKTAPIPDMPIAIFG